MVVKMSSRMKSVTPPVIKEELLTTNEGRWDITFQPGRGAPASAKFDELTSYTTIRIQA